MCCMYMFHVYVSFLSMHEWLVVCVNIVYMPFLHLHSYVRSYVYALILPMLNRMHAPCCQLMPWVA